jgi:hypothetical protein
MIHYYLSYTVPTKQNKSKLQININFLHSLFKNIRPEIYCLFLQTGLRVRNCTVPVSKVSDPYSFFTDPDPDDPDGSQYGSGSNPDPGL